MHDVYLFSIERFIFEFSAVRFKYNNTNLNRHEKREKDKDEYYRRPM